MDIKVIKISTKVTNGDEKLWNRTKCGETETKRNETDIK